MEMTAARSLADLAWDNRFTDELVADVSDENRPRQVTGAHFTRVTPTPTAAPRLLAYSPEVLAELGLDPAVVDTDEFVAAMSGNGVVAGMDPHAAAYGGHQFGNWAGQLGDGRAITLGEIVAADGRRHMLQLKGAGRTPYSRTADGRAVLRSSVREFLCSEAMHHLGVPTTRALSLCATGDIVVRDMFYDGNPEPEPGAVVCRVAPSFIRFGNFEIFAARDDLGNLQRLLDHTIVNHFPDLGEPGVDTYVALVAEVARRTADMIVHWQRVGFVHGVMNTDNMSIHGLTIDYGPYGWVDDYDPNWTPNTTDAGGRRYRFANQPGIAQWNLMRLASAIHAVVGEAEPLQDALNAYVERFNTKWPAMMAAKIGIADPDGDGDRELISRLLDLMERAETDMTILFRSLADVPVAGDGDDSDDEALLAPLADAWYQPDQLDADLRSGWATWLRDRNARLAAEGRSDDERRATMNAVNPRYVLRNYLAQLAIDDATARSTELLHELLDVLRRPYDDQPGRHRFAAKRPDWARTRAGCSMLSCSS